jgi:hypothetical protein
VAAVQRGEQEHGRAAAVAEFDHGLTWIWAAGAAGRYAAGFTNGPLTILSSPLTPGDTNLLALTNLPTVTMSGGSLTNDLVLTATAYALNKFSFTNGNALTSLKLTVSTTTGKLTGTWKPPQFGGNTTPFAGVVLTNQAMGRGFFTPNVGAGTNQSGSFELNQ